MPDLNANNEPPETGFIKMSHFADEKDDVGGESRIDYLDATERLSDLQQLLVEEIQARPFRAVGWAAIAGLAIGVWAAR
jgi:hypothetical protein